MEIFRLSREFTQKNENLVKMTDFLGFYFSPSAITELWVKGRKAIGCICGKVVEKIEKKVFSKRLSILAYREQIKKSFPHQTPGFSLVFPKNLSKKKIFL